MLEAFEQRTLDLANRLTDMTYIEWEFVQNVINQKFAKRKRELNRTIQLSNLTEKDL